MKKNPQMVGQLMASDIYDPTTLFSKALEASVNQQKILNSHVQMLYGYTDA